MNQATEDRALNRQDWLDSAGDVITCTGKLRILRENEDELRQVLLDACKDALLMEVGPQILRQRMGQLLDEVLTEAGAMEDRAGDGRAEMSGHGRERL